MSEDWRWAYHGDESLFAALDDGPVELPDQVNVGDEVKATAKCSGRYGSVVVLRRDEEDVLLDDTYLLARGPDGHWRSPGSSSGSGMPEWVLRRPAAPLEAAGWSGGDLVVLRGQVAHRGVWLADLTVMATVRVARLEVEYDGHRLRVEVPKSGLVTMPLVLRQRHYLARCAGFDVSGRLVDTCSYQPLTLADRGWPDPIFWT